MDVRRELFEHHASQGVREVRRGRRAEDHEVFLGLPLAMNKTESARALGVSVDFFDDHIASELRCVRRGRRRLYPTSELRRWLEEEAERVDLQARAQRVWQ